MREIIALTGIALIIVGAHQLFGPWADIVAGVLLLAESRSLKTGENNVS